MVSAVSQVCRLNIIYPHLFPSWKIPLYKVKIPGYQLHDICPLLATVSYLSVPGSSQQSSHNSPKKQSSQLPSMVGTRVHPPDGLKSPHFKKEHRVAPAKQSMLQKFRSGLPSSPRQAGLGKRTSSSSGFSSARSDRSESSVSVSYIGNIFSQH